MSAAIPDIHDLFATLAEHEGKFNRSFSLVPSENLISPLTRAAFLSDSFSRYFFDEHEVFGRWNFQGGSIVGRIQKEIVTPLLRDLGRAAHVNLHAISGLSGMTLALAAYGGDPGNRVVTVAVANGGHPDTSYVAQKLGYVPLDLPFGDYDEIDLDALAELVRTRRPSLVYIDHATALRPLPLHDLVTTVREAQTEPVHVHIDSSHVNGLVWGGQLTNPLAAGADTYGGSTHKTFPGPHKAVLFTDSEDTALRLTLTGVNMISHHHPASVVALGISLLEFAHRGGREYAARTIANARAFAAALAARGLAVQGRPDEGYTRTHQVWVKAPPEVNPYEVCERLFAAGLIVNPYNLLPSLGGPGIRMGVNEATKLGLVEDDMERLAETFAAVVLRGEPPEALAGEVAEFRAGFTPSFCYRDDEMRVAWKRFADTLSDDRSQYVGGSVHDARS
ncbi:hypothetical protein [Actinomadura roseirufa]|uniref:hypothetical protein n=1 Tax=Actinomadura roseirufa TaxID=2094049 RepID=UPI00104172F6|nr:hypothetical protein [Actinomadura roseirufa]